MNDLSKTLELVVKALVAVVGGILGLYLAGWVMRLLAGLFLGLAGLLVALLKFLVPVAVIAGIVYVVVSQLRPKETRDAGENPEDKQGSFPVPVVLETMQQPAHQAEKSETGDAGTNHAPNVEKAVTGASILGVEVIESKPEGVKTIEIKPETPEANKWISDEAKD